MPQKLRAVPDFNKYGRVTYVFLSVKDENAYILHGIVNRNRSTLLVHIYQYAHLHNLVKIGHSDLI